MDLFKSTKFYDEFTVSEGNLSGESHRKREEVFSLSKEERRRNRGTDTKVMMTKRNGTLLNNEILKPGESGPSSRSSRHRRCKRSLSYSQTINSMTCILTLIVPHVFHFPDFFLFLPFQKLTVFIY